MDLLTLSDQLNACFESCDEVQQLYSIVITYKAEQSVKDLIKTQKELPPLIVRALSGTEPLKTILKAVPITNAHAAYRAVSRWLDLVLYTVCDYLPYLNEKNAHNAAIAHPISIWLYKEHTAIEACYHVGMFLNPKKELPLVLVKLPELVERFRTFVLPKMQEFHTSAADQLRQVRPEYMELGNLI